MDFDSDFHLATSLKLSGLLRRVIEPLAGCYEDKRFGRGVTGDTTFEIDQPIEAAVYDYFEVLDLPLVIYTEDQGEVRFGDDDPLAYYLIDPLDGSRNARRGLPVYSTSIAVYPPEAGSLDEVGVGVVSRLDGVDDFWAIKGKGAYCGKKPLKPSPKTDLTNAVISVGSHLTTAYHVHAGFMARMAADVEDEVSDLWVKAYGSSALEMAFIAAGYSDIMVDLRAGCGLDATPKTYDIAAAMLLCRESGAEVSYGGAGGMDGGLPIDPSIRVQFLAAGNKTLYDLASNYLE
ncbi:inositol monophosphatase family protein [Candidatus Altiarchaeota archaeon]